MTKYIGIDIGGTKTAVLCGTKTGEVLYREQIPTPDCSGTLNWIDDQVIEILSKHEATAIGISCGGPLDSKRGVILSPPNLPGWDEVEIVKRLKDRYKLPTALENDANAGALAEWKFGAGQGYQNIVFLTFGTGCGAGLILDGKLYRGTNSLAGEIGHWRLTKKGPVGFGKEGSLEGYCSGPGLVRIAHTKTDPRMLSVLHFGERDSWTGKDISEAALDGDAFALEVIAASGKRLGQALALVVDILNPEIIIIGSMGFRLGDLLLEPAREIISKEAMEGAAKICQLVPAQTGEHIGDLAALAIAMNI